MVIQKTDQTMQAVQNENLQKVREKEIEERRIHKTRRKMWTEDF